MRKIGFTVSVDPTVMHEIKEICTVYDYRSLGDFIRLAVDLFIDKHYLEPDKFKHLLRDQKR